MNLTKQEKKQLRAAVIVLLVYLVVSVFFWLAVRWWAGLIPTVVILLAEYSLQVRRHKTFKIPAIRQAGAAIVRVYHRLRRLNRVVFPSRKVVVEENRTVAELKANVITSISILTLRDFKICACDGNLNVLGTGTEGELKTAWGDILSQYYFIIDSDEMKHHNKMQKDIALLELRKARSESMIETLRAGIYMPEAVAPLRELYKAYAFTKESYAADIEMVHKGEIHYKRKLDELKKAFEKSQSKTTQSPAQKRKELTSLLMDINKIEGCRYDDSITVETFAMGLKRRAEHIENLIEQNRR